MLPAKYRLPGRHHNNVDDERRIYLGLSETPFKDRDHNHVRGFNNEIYTLQQD